MITYLLPHIAKGKRVAGSKSVCRHEEVATQIIISCGGATPDIDIVTLHCENSVPKVTLSIESVDIDTLIGLQQQIARAITQYQGLVKAPDDRERH